MFWLAVFVVSLLLAVALAPRPEQTPGPVAGQQKTPEAEEGRPIPVLFGTREIKSPQVMWYGDVSTKAIKKKGGKK